MNEENWKEEAGGKNNKWPIERMPYQLKFENCASYGQECHFCNSQQMHFWCPVPFSTKATVLDYLHKIGVEDNISFYGTHGNQVGGKFDLILQLHWHTDWDRSLQRQLSGVVEPTFANEKEA